MTAGYLLRTFGPTNWQTKWYPFTYFGWTPDHIDYNADGTVTINNNAARSGVFNAAIATSQPNAGVPNAFQNGTAFGGGAYFEAVMRWTPVLAGSLPLGWPSFWSLPFEQDNATGIYSNQWPGQATGYHHGLEWDFMEYDSTLTTKFGVAMHDDYGLTGSSATVNANTGVPSIPGIDFSQFHKFGFLWIAATSGSSGVAKFYVDDVQVGNTVTWALNTDASTPPPPAGTQIASILDKRHLFLILGNSTQGTTGIQMIVKEVNVWQATDANNYHL